MTTTTIRNLESRLIVPGRQSIKTAADTLLHAMTETGLEDPRWESAGPLVSAAAQRLREALGTAVRGDCVSGPAVVRETDFALSARPLLADAAVVDPNAARQFVGLAVEAALALS
jgi:hypothetical protein